MIISFVALLTGLAPAAHAAKCSTATAAGIYGFSDSGTVVGVGPRAAVGQLTLDAAGNIKGTVTASLAGGVSSTTVSGTYAVNPDCTGTTSFGEYDQSGNLILTATVDIVWDDNMREIRFLFTSIVLADGTHLMSVVNGDARKLVSGSEDN
jgi:hypothetical protein